MIVNLTDRIGNTANPYQSIDVSTLMLRRYDVVGGYSNTRGIAAPSSHDTIMWPVHPDGQVRLGLGVPNYRNYLACT